MLDIEHNINAVDKKIHLLKTCRIKNGIGSFYYPALINLTVEGCV